MSKACPKLPVFHDMSIVEKSNSLIEIIQICLKIYLYTILDHSWRLGGVILSHRLISFSVKKVHQIHSWQAPIEYVTDWAEKRLQFICLFNSKLNFEGLII